MTTSSSSAPRGFRRTLTLGAITALSLPVALWVIQGALGAFDLLGSSRASRGVEVGLSLYWLLAAAGLLAVSASSGRTRARVLLAAFLGGPFLLLATPALPALAVVLTCAVAFARSGLLTRQAPARAIAIELTCGVLSLGLAAVLYTPTVLGAALSLWGWFLVQSCFHLLSAITPRRRPSDDPFDAARARLLELLGP